QLVLLAVAAAAAYDPEGSYAVGDYCTHGGKLHKCNTPIPSGEAWNAEHWTETTVAAELLEQKQSPNTYQLAPVDGFSAVGYYFKTKDGVVTILSLLGGSEPFTGTNKQVATLPEEFRPKSLMYVPGLCLTSGKEYVGSSVAIFPDGRITNVCYTSNSLQNLAISCSFVAEK
ncbi:hypothetical protein, partial [uncultured Agathobaculum sp.]|uniref:hypothetical protein n=1 Tax=uncultured Agathobaculum sp. TaxID=2048140 RepID=UPI003208C0F7